MARPTTRDEEEAREWYDDKGERRWRNEGGGEEGLWEVVYKHEHTHKSCKLMKYMADRVAGG